MTLPQALIAFFVAGVVLGFVFGMLFTGAARAIRKGPF
jgi:hypothetical protein